MELTKEEMLRRLRSVGTEIHEYQVLLRKMESINIENEYAAIKAEEKAMRGPGIITNILAIAIGFLSFWVYIVIAYLIFGTSAALNIMIIVLILCVATGFLARHFIHEKIIDYSMNKIKGDDNEDVQNLQAQASVLSEKMSQKIGFLDAEYCYPWAIDDLDKIFRTGRADTLKEGLRELEEDIHRYNMEQAAQKGNR